MAGSDQGGKAVSWSNDKWGIVSAQDNTGKVVYYRTGATGSKDRLADLSVTVTGTSYWYKGVQMRGDITATFTNTTYFTMKGGGQKSSATGN